MAKNCQQCGTDVSRYTNAQVQFCRPCSDLRTKTKPKDKIYYCLQCGNKRQRSRTRYCSECHGIGNKQNRAHSAVAKARQQGLLPDLREVFVKCADCDNRASDYDHRDYNYPLLVSAVCRPCNAKRGPAKNSPALSAMEAA